MPDFAPALDDGQHDYATAAQRDALNAAIDTAARHQAARMYRGGTWDMLTEHDKHACRALVADAVRVGWDARGEL